MHLPKRLGDNFPSRQALSLLLKLLWNEPKSPSLLEQVKSGMANYNCQRQQGCRIPLPSV